MGNYACLHCVSLANSSVRLFITCAHPDHMHFFEFCGIFVISVCILLVLDLCTWSTNKYNNNNKYSRNGWILLSRKRHSSCDTEISTRLGKAFGRMNNIWSNRRLKTEVKIWLHEALVMSILLYGIETWPMIVTNMKRLETAHHWWQRKILCISWKDKIRNEEVRKRTEMITLENTIRKRRLRWFDHVQRME